MTYRDEALWRAIRTEAAAYFGITLGSMESKSTSRNKVSARHLAWWLARRETELTHARIARLAHRDHSSVVHGVKMWDERIQKQNPWAVHATRTVWDSARDRMARELAA